MFELKHRLLKFTAQLGTVVMMLTTPRISLIPKRHTPLFMSQIRINQRLCAWYFWGRLTS